METQANKLIWWRNVDAELIKLGEYPSEIGEYQSACAAEAATEATRVAKRIRESRIRSYHAEEGHNI